MEFEPQTQKEVVNYRRLYGQFNREVLLRMEAHGMEINEEPYDVDAVLLYLKNSDLRSSKIVEDRNAAKAQVFHEWLTEKGFETTS